MNRLTPRAAAALVVAATVLAFSYTLTCDFAGWDDDVTIVYNLWMTEVGWATVAHYWTHTAANIYVPLTYTAWAAIALVAKVAPDHRGVAFNPLFFHAASVAAHCGAALAVFALLLRLQDKPSPDLGLSAPGALPPNPTPHVGVAAACFGALLFALHPLQVESVAWASGLKDVLAGGLSIAAVWQFVCWRKAAAERRRRHYAAFLVLLALALLAKPSAMTTPAVVLAIDVLLLRTPVRRSVLALLPTALLIVPIMLVAKAAQPASETVSPLLLRPLVALDAIAFYMTKLVAPLRLCIDYARNPEDILASGAAYYTWVLPVGALLAAVAVWRRWNSRVPLAALMVFVLAPLHVLGLVRFDFQRFSTVADHYAYVALLGPAILGAHLLRTGPRSRTAVAALVLVTLSVLTFLQTRHWKDEPTVMRHALAVSPRSRFPAGNLAAWHVREGNHAAARPYVELAMQRDPRNPLIYLTAGQVALVERRPEAAREAFESLLSMYRHGRLADAHRLSRAHFTIAKIYLTFEYPAEAAPHVDALERMTPNDPSIPRLRRTIQEQSKKASARPG
ncbi:MAG TPA: hypothetical protein VF624_17980 [Tepidisphaeraceae bacterium]